MKARQKRPASAGRRGRRKGPKTAEEAPRASLDQLQEPGADPRNFQQAMINLLEDFQEERIRAGQSQTALMNILEDIESEHAETERARAMLEAVNKELEAFSYSVSHDLRAPLRAISGFAQALTEDCAPRLDDEGRRYLTLIRDNAHKMGRLIDDLLAFSRMGRQQMLKTEVDMDRLARTLFAELTAPHKSAHRIEFKVHGAPPARGDQAMIHQVLANLLANAIKFSRNRPAPRIEFGCLTREAEQVYYVRDNGVGFDMQYADKLFGVFQRLHSVTEFEGTGVGLALVQRIVMRHGGRVWAEGKPDEGATFYFTLSAGATP